MNPLEGIMESFGQMLVVGAIAIVIAISAGIGCIYMLGHYVWPIW